MTPTCWQIRLLGGLQAQWGDLIVTQFPRRKVATLLAWLARFSHQAHSREALAEMLWPDEEPEPVQDRFRHALAELRKLLEPEGVERGYVVLADRNEVRLNPACIQVDVVLFETGLQAASRAETPETRAQHLLDCLQQYRGDLLPGYYEDWILRERERLADRYRSALCGAAEGLARHGEIEPALELARRAVESDPLMEEAHGLLMRLYELAGRPADIVRQYRRLERTLQEELGQQPSSALTQIYEQLRRQETVLPQRSPIELVSAAAPQRLEPTGGAVPLESKFYLIRPVDEEFNAAVAHRDSIVLIKGARQAGKTSLLGRGLQQTRQSGARTFVTDLQKFTAPQMETADALFRVIAQAMIDGLDLDVDLDAFWKSGYGWNVNFERFMRRQVLGKLESHLVWALDEVDRLFSHPYSTEVFGLFRSWHNERSLDPTGPWAGLTLCIAYATEVHLFIKDLNQSPFNVGTRLSLDDFAEADVAEINRRYGAPLRTPQEVQRFYRLVGGNPYLVRRGLHALAAEPISLADLEAGAESDDGVFGDPLRRMLAALRRDPALMEAIVALLANRSCPTVESFYRLKSAGVIIGASAANARFRCQLYRTYLEMHLKEV